MKQHIWIPTLLAILAITAGCGSHGYSRADRAADSVQNAAARVDLGASQMAVALATLSDLVDNPGADLRPQFGKFNSAAKILASLSRDIAAKSDAMQKKGTVYFQKWDEELARIQNEDIRSRSAARKMEVEMGFQRVQANYQATAGLLSPFISRLSDIRTALSADLTPAGLEAVRGLVSAARTEGLSVQQSLQNLSTDFKSLGTSLKPAAPQPTQPHSPSSPPSPSVGS